MDPRAVTMMEITALIRPFEQAVEEMGLDLEIRLRSPGSDHDRYVLQTGHYADEHLRRHPICPDDKENPDDH